MIGDDPNELEKGNDNIDTYVIQNTACVVVLVGVGNNDTIFLPSTIEPAVNGSSENIVTVANMPTGTPTEKTFSASLGGYDFGTRGKPIYHFPFKVTLTKIEYDGTYKIVNSQREFTKGAEKSRSTVFTFYYYARGTAKLEDLKSHLQSKIKYGDTMGYRGVYEPKG
jgi:hypothetical protein